MNRHTIIQLYQDTIITIYHEENLTCLRGLDNNYQLKDKQFLQWHSEVTRKCRVKYQKFNAFKNIDDLLLYSDEVMYFTAQLYLYRPYINNPLREAFRHQQKIVYPNNQNFEAKRYNIYSDIAMEKLYSYWHRIGDLIASFFPDLIKPERVYFPTAFDIIPETFHNHDSYKWLKEFREITYKKLNGKRKEIVHYTSSDTDVRYKHLSVATEKEGIEKWIEARNSIPDFFKEQMPISLEGFYQTITLLEIIDKEMFKDIE